MNEFDHRHFEFVRQSGIPRGELGDNKPVVSDSMVLTAAILCAVAVIGIMMAWGMA